MGSLERHSCRTQVRRHCSPARTAGAAPTMWWLQLAVVCACASGRRAAVAHLPDLETFNIADDSRHSHGAEAEGGAVLALELRSWGAREPLRVRAATDDEARRYRELVQPIIHSSASGRRPAAAPRAAADDDASTLRDIRTVVNKFIVSEQGPLDADQPTLSGEDDPTLTVYVSGECGVLVLVTARREWRFVLPAPPPLPARLLAPGPLPATLQTEFYHTLLRLLKVFLRFDL